MPPEGDQGDTLATGEVGINTPSPLIRQPASLVNLSPLSGFTKSGGPACTSPWLWLRLSKGTRSPASPIELLTRSWKQPRVNHGWILSWRRPSLRMWRPSSQARTRPRDLIFVSANITAWSPEILRWHQPGQGPLLIQELHLGYEGVGKLRIDALTKGYHLFLPPVEGPRPTKGGVATLIPIHMQGRHRGGYLSEDGAGFVIVELPRVRYSLLVVNLYLRPGVGITGGPNPQILARLLPLLKQGTNWIVAGDWNFPSQELEGTSLPISLRGKVVAPGEATISTGNCLDYAIASLRVAPLLQCSANWSVPFRPHAAVAFRLATSGGQVPLPQLSSFEGSLRPREDAKEAVGPAVSRSETPILTALHKTWGRGCARPIVHKPLMQPKSRGCVVWAGSFLVAEAAASVGAPDGLPLSL